jgi:L-ribulose-5-phosphate 3-epimerase
VQLKNFDFVKTPLTRRNFLKTSGAALAAAALASHHAAESPKRAIKKAIMYSTIGVKGSVLEKFKAVKEAGFSGVEPMGGMNQEEVIAAMKETGLQAASVCCHTHWAKPLSSANPEERRVGLEGLLLSLRDAKAYGAGSVLLVPGVARGGVTYEQCWERSIAEIRKAIPVAAELGVKISIENVWNDFIMKHGEAVRYLDEINSPHVAWHFDIGNIIYFEDPVDWIKALGKRIARLHIKEFSRDLAMKRGRGAGFAAKFLEGANNWPAIMKALDEVGYDGWGIAEQGGGDSLDGLKDLSARMDKIFAS